MEEKDVNSSEEPLEETAGGGDESTPEETSTNELSNTDEAYNEPQELEGEDCPEGFDEDDATDPNPSASTRDVFVMNGCYYKWIGSRNPQLKMVTNFTLQPKAKVILNGNWFYPCVGAMSTGQTYDINLFRDEFMSTSTFKRALSVNSDFEYYGNNGDTTQIQGLLADQNPPTVDGTDKNGIHLVNNRLVYVEGNHAIDKDGLATDIVYMNKRSQTHRMPCLLNQPDISQAALKAIASDLSKFNDSTIVFPILGFIGYCFAKEALSEKVSYHNPFLLCQGEPGTGKSETISRIIMPIFSSCQSFANIASITEFALALNSSSSNMTPACYDEYKHSALSRPQRRIIENVLLSSYAQNPLERGRADKRIDNLNFTAPFVLAGEMTIESTSLNHRRVEVFFSYKKRKGYQENYLRLTGQALGAFGKGLLHHTLQLGADRLRTEYERQEIFIDDSIDSRFRENAALIRTGLWLVTDYLESNGIDVDCYNKGFDIIDSVIKESVNASKLSNVDKAFTDFCTMASTGVIQNRDDYEVKGSYLCLKIAAVYAKYQRWIKRNGTSEFIGKNSFLQQLDEKEYFVDKKTERIGGKPCNAVRLDLSCMPEGVEVDWPGYNPSQESDDDSNGSGDDDEPWQADEQSDEDYKSLMEEIYGVQAQDEIYNSDVDFIAMKDGELTLAGQLHQILYQDRSLELCEIVDELWKRGWNPTDHHNERIVKMLLTNSHLFRHIGNGWCCPSSGRMYY